MSVDMSAELVNRAHEPLEFANVFRKPEYNAQWTAAYRPTDAVEASDYAQGFSDTFVRVEQHWNGHWLRPPVGMSAAQASHQWVMCFTNDPSTMRPGMWLEPRITDDARRRDAEFSRKVRSTQA